MFVGVPKDIDSNIPYAITDFSTWDTRKNRFRMKNNPAFVSMVDSRSRLLDHGKNNTIILICRSGKRSARASKLLFTVGYKKVFTVVDGFEGNKKKKGELKGKRVVNGWKNSALPWGYKLNHDKVTLIDNRTSGGK